VIETVRDLLKLTNELSGASVFSLVLLATIVLGYVVYKYIKKNSEDAKKCGVQKSLLVGHVQKLHDLDPNEALSKTNQMTKEALLD